MTRDEQPYTFVSFARHPWSNVWQAWQYVMSSLARTHHVLFCSRTATWEEYVHALKIRRPIRWRSRRIQRNLLDMPPWPWLPRVPEWRGLDEAMLRVQTARLRSSMYLRGWDNRILYIWHPDMADMVGRFGERLVCFHVYDDYAGYTYPTPKARQRIIDNTARLLDRADLVFAAGSTMRATLDRDDVHIVPNGVDYDLFSSAHSRNEPPPPDIAQIPHPIVAHVGRLNVKVDYRLLTEIARARPDWSVVLLGPFTGFFPPEEQAAIDTLLALPNAHHIPGKPSNELPNYVRHIDVALMAYRPIGWVQSISPVKLYEYTAAGKPIVAANIEELRQFPDYVTIAETPEGWIAAIDHWLANDSEALAVKRRALALENSWDTRCEQILRFIAERLNR